VSTLSGRQIHSLSFSLSCAETLPQLCSLTYPSHIFVSLYESYLTCTARGDAFIALPARGPASLSTHFVIIGSTFHSQGLNSLGSFPSAMITVTQNGTEQHAPLHFLLVLHSFRLEGRSSPVLPCRRQTFLAFRQVIQTSIVQLVSSRPQEQVRFANNRHELHPLSITSCRPSLVV
jgi:hypothetical protein